MRGILLAKSIILPRLSYFVLRLITNLLVLVFVTEFLAFERGKKTTVSFNVILQQFDPTN